MSETIPLNPITLPLNQISLIEASAGTGKTYTIGSLYLRLLLKAGEKDLVNLIIKKELLVEVGVQIISIPLVMGRVKK